MRLAWFPDFCLAVVLFLSPLIYGKLDRWGRITEGAQVLVLSLICLGWLAVLGPTFFRNARLRITRTPANPAILAFLAIGAASILVSVNPHASLIEFLRLLTGALLFWLLIDRARERGRILWFVVSLVVSGWVVAWIGCRDYFVQVHLGNPSWRIFSTFYNPNCLAGFLIMILPLAAVVFFISKTLWQKMASGCGLGLLLVALMLTGSRGGWLSFMIAVMFYVALLIGSSSAGQTSNRSRQIALGVLALIVVVAMALLIPPIRLRIMSGFSPEVSSNMFRYLTWQATLGIISDHPWLGTGLGTFQYIFPKYAIGGFTRMAHQNYLQMGAEIGLLGLATFIWLLVTFWVIWLRAFRARPEPNERYLLIAAASGMLAFSMHSLLDYGWYLGVTALSFWFLLGITVSLSTPPIREVRLPATPWFRWLGFLALLGVMGFILLVSFRSYWGSLHAQRARKAESAGNYWDAIAEWRAAVESDPGDGLYHRYLGRALGIDGISEVKRAIELEPTNSLNYGLLGNMEASAGEWKAAVSSYGKAIAFNPQHLKSYLGLGTSYRRLEDLNKAWETYLRMIEIEKSPSTRYSAIEGRVDVDYAFAHYELGRLYGWDLRLNWGSPLRLHRAGKEFDQALEVIDSYREQSQAWDQLMKKLGQGIPREKEELILLRAKIYWRLGVIWQEREDRPKAEQFKSQAKELEPDIKWIIGQEG